MEENNTKTLTLNGLVPLNFLYLTISVAMVFAGIYLTNHYYDLTNPTDGLKGASTLCNINDFFGCDKATLSNFGTILGVPTSIFGIIMGVIGMITSFAGTKEFEQTTKTILLINLIACLALFIYSLVELKSLCPVCTAYYVLSLLAYALFHKFSDLPFGFAPLPGGIFAAILVIPVAGIAISTSAKKENASMFDKELITDYVKEFDSLIDYGEPTVESDYKLNMATENFKDAPLRITIYSDFECPYCKAVSDQMHEVIKTFKDKVNIQYMFYPLDNNCNTEMKGSLHLNACNAAYLAACDKTKFAEVHDYIFANQNSINLDNLKEWAYKFGLSESCLTDQKTADVVQQTLKSGKQFKLRSTPTLIVNGKKLEGMIETKYFKAILEAQLKK